MKSLAKIVAMGLVMSSVPVMGAWAKDLVVTERSQWDYKNSSYSYRAYTPFLHTDNNFHDVTIFMDGKEQNAQDAKDGYSIPFDAVNHDDANFPNAIFKADGNVYIKDSCISTQSTNAVYTRLGSADKPNIDFRGAEKVVVIANALQDGYGSQALSAKNGGCIAIATQETGYTKIIGDIDMAHSKGGTISVDLNNKNSYWYGNHKIDYEKEILRITLKLQNEGNLQLTIRNGAEWIYTTGAITKSFEEKAYTTGTYIGNVTLKDGGIINLRNADVQKKFAEVNNDEALRSEEFGALHMYDNGDHRYVQIGTLKGNGGIFKVDLKYTAGDDKAITSAYKVKEDSDYIYITKSGEGTHDVQFVADKANLDAMGKDSKLYFANDKSGGVTFKSSTVEALAPKTSAANLYDYKYAVKNEANGNAKDWFIALDQGDANENIPAAFKAMQAGYALGTEMDRFNKRMGESRYLEGDSGLWVRYRHARTGWENSFKTNSNMFQVGFDKLKLEKDGKHYRGGAVDYTDANTSLFGLKGNGEHERYALSLYDTWIGDKGHYLDLVLRGGRTSNDLDVTTRNQEIIKGKYHQNFGSISGEWGRKLANDNGWYVEPQAQLQIARVGSADYRTNYGVKVEQDAATSVIARAGFRLGRDFSDKGNFYMKADWLHEFCGDQNIRVSAADGSEQSSFNGQDSWWDLGLGADFSLGKDTYLYCDFERTLGGNYDRTWQANVGLRYAF